MKRLLPDSLAARTMALLVVGLAVTHLISNVFYMTDRKDALLASGGDHVIQWVAMVGALAEAYGPEERGRIVDTAEAAVHFTTITDAPVLSEDAGDDWRADILREELAGHVVGGDATDLRIAWAGAGAQGPALDYWRAHLARKGVELPDEMLMVSLRLSDGAWINVAAPLRR